LKDAIPVAGKKAPSESGLTLTEGGSMAYAAQKVVTRTMHTLSDVAGRFSLTPCFSGVFLGGGDPNRFNGFSHADETVETVGASHTSPYTPLKQGVNERSTSRRRKVFEIFRIKAVGK
jgi:hypothetical protein